MKVTDTNNIQTEVRKLEYLGVGSAHATNIDGSHNYCNHTFINAHWINSMCVQTIDSINFARTKV